MSLKNSELKLTNNFLKGEIYMQKTMKKTLSIILAILMIVTMIPFTPIAFAADDYAVVDTEAGTVTIDGTLGGKTTATEEDLNAMVEILKNCVES